MTQKKDNDNSNYDLRYHIRIIPQMYGKCFLLEIK